MALRTKRQRVLQTENFRSLRDFGSSETGSARKRRLGPRRRGAASLDYVLILGVILPMVAFIILRGREIMRLVYEFLCVMVAWPFL
jgi:hypothetical protein